MTRRELTELLAANFAEDEEVTFVYSDDQGDVRTTSAEVRDHETEVCVGHWELARRPVRDDVPLEWRRVSREEYLASRRDPFTIVRWVDDGPPARDVRKALVVG